MRIIFPISVIAILLLPALAIAQNESNETIPIQPPGDIIDIGGKLSPAGHLVGGFLDKQIKLGFLNLTTRNIITFILLGAIIFVGFSTLISNLQPLMIIIALLVVLAIIINL